LCHGERNNAIRHRLKSAGTGEDARRSTTRRSIAGLPARQSATDQRLTTSDGFIPGWVYSGLIPTAAIILPVTPFSAR
jgi:hypothetical protein